MDLFDVLLQIGAVTGAIVAYLIFFKRSSPIPLKGNYRQPGWNYYFRVIFARWAVRRWKSRRAALSGQREESESEYPRAGKTAGWDCISIRATAPDGSALLLAVRKLCTAAHPRPLAEATLYLRLADGTIYKHTQHPDTVVGPWKEVERTWSTGDLTIEVLEPEKRLRILYNGLLKRQADGAMHHVTFNLLWTSASHVFRFPEDWSSELAAKALALEPWRDGDWPRILDSVGLGGWLQWGCVQGRVQWPSGGRQGEGEYLRVRGVKERSWSVRGYQRWRRALTLTAAAADGTALQLRGFAIDTGITEGYSGCVRFPDSSVHSITDTDLALADVCEHPGGIPDTFTVTVTTSQRTVRVVVRVKQDGGELLSGVPYQQELLYSTAVADIDGHAGSAILELGYHTDRAGPVVGVPRIELRWAKESDVGDVGYCASFEAPAAACPGYVGGKGASLALLASAQDALDYKVPPGFCLTTKALERHLQANPQIIAAIREIEAANENYEECNFRTKCNKVVDLFTRTEIVEDVRAEIATYLAALRAQATDPNLGPELRFAVRSSAVGEDSEALSAAGQNETVLGCASETDVVRGVQLCWGSMFAFTSAHYRRQNGQPCLCGGAVVVQALVAARAAGVMFTRHPAAGDPARLLITANYGLGETVVSGAVEPDTIVVDTSGSPRIASVSLGSKRRRLLADVGGVASSEVPAAERGVPSVTAAEILALAEIGVAQERAWGAARDIEWAVAGTGTPYLLQARPVTSLQRWTEDELLHEFDTPVMADDELITFANTGEVLPKAVSAMSYDLSVRPLASGMDALYGDVASCYVSNISITHLRCCLAMYNTLYRTPPAKLDLMTRIMEMSISGNKIADENILSIAQHRRKRNWRIMLHQMYIITKFVLVSKSAMNHCIKIAKSLELNLDVDDPMSLLESIADKYPLLFQSAKDHGTTSGASSVTQCIAMAVLAEGGNDFTNEQCNEMSVLLSSGDVLSAEVPMLLAAMARELQLSGHAEQFRAQPPQQALAYLQHNVPQVYHRVQQYLQQHGHRAVMEFDFYTKPWALEPHKMMEVLQNMRVSTKEETPKHKSDDEVIASLKTPKKSSTRTILRWVVPLCRRTVRHRENTKAHLCLVLHKIRVAFIHLGKLLVKQWYIPDEDLVFHFRLHELRDYLVTRDPALLRKAIQRRQYHPSWCKLKFAELNTGWVEPLKSKAAVLSSGDVTATGTVVCGGEVVARACVVKEFSEVSQLQRGDILITHSTDIGWSPYFPLLSGIVTELGGIISHGAVIAREYGLPCIVGVTDATDMFQTGDMVRLAATKGLLERVQMTEEQKTEYNKEQSL